MIGRGAIAAGGMILVVCAAWAASQESASHGENRQLCEKIVRKVVEGKPEAAFAALEPRCVIPKGTLQPVREQTIQKLADARKAFGTIIGFDLIKEERVRDFAHRLTYVTRGWRCAGASTSTGRGGIESG